MSQQEPEEDLEVRVQRLESKVELLHDLVKDLRSRIDGDDAVLEMDAWDRYDRYVIKHCKQAETHEFHLTRLRKYYRRSGIKQNSTLRNRIEELTTIGPFEWCGDQTWRYTGGSP